ncbi:hypothetical protein ACFSJ3_09665 [Corallincola platygyrae]|uniref:Uncharacterized protein n=1 Tax=Corallincola platygyrae TaxID=1193278 RepID=A0ABW4XP69_9GAMM
MTKFKLSSITLLALLVTGCPALMYGHLKNSSQSDLVVIPPNVPENPWIIDSGETVRIVWHQECIIIRDGMETKYFLSWPLPENTVTSGVFSSSINAVYSNGSLYIETKDGALVQTKETSSCAQ